MKKNHYSDIKKVLIIGRGIFEGPDTPSAVALKKLANQGLEVVLVSSDPMALLIEPGPYAKTYFEPLTLNFLLKILYRERPDSLITSFGGRIAEELVSQLAKNGHLKKLGIKLLNDPLKNFTSVEDFCLSILPTYQSATKNPFLSKERIVILDSGIKTTAEEQELNFVNVSAIQAIQELGFEAVIITDDPSNYLTELGSADRLYQVSMTVEDILHVITMEKPKGVLALSGTQETIRLANSLSSRGINVFHTSHSDMTEASEKDIPQEGRTLEVVTICDGENVCIFGIVGHVEMSNLHPEGSIAISPDQFLSGPLLDKISSLATSIGLSLKVRGPMNIWLTVHKEEIFVRKLEVHLSPSLPFLTKTTGLPLAKILTKVILGVSLREQGHTQIPLMQSPGVWIKCPKGHVMTSDPVFGKALFKAYLAANIVMPEHGIALIDLNGQPSAEALQILNRFYKLGFEIVEVRNESFENTFEDISYGYISYIITLSATSILNVENQHRLKMSAAENRVLYHSTLEAAQALVSALEERTYIVQHLT